MHDVLDDLESAWHAGRSVGLATLTGTWHSAPRQPGATMLVDEDRAIGSVSCGCVEGAVYELAREVAAEGSPVLTRYGVSDGDALEVGLTCGGQLQLFAQPVSPATFPELPEVAADIRAGRPVAVATVIEHPEPAFVGLRLVVRPEGLEGRPQAASHLDHRGTGRPQAASHLDQRMSTRQVAALTDDARGLLAQGLSEVLTVLTHDPKFDIPLLEVALRLEQVAYVGAMGSRRTHDQRLAQLREVGVSDDEIARLSSPIGLDLGARTPEETAVSIAAEIISLRWGGAGSRLSDRGGPIHHPPA